MRIVTCLCKSTPRDTRPPLAVDRCVPPLLNESSSNAIQTHTRARIPPATNTVEIRQGRPSTSPLVSEMYGHRPQYQNNITSKGISLTADVTLHHPLQEHGYALSPADTGAPNGPFGAPSPHLMDEVSGDAGARGTYTGGAGQLTHQPSEHTVPVLTQRVPESNGSSIEVGLLWVKLQLLHHSQVLGSKGLIHLHMHTQTHIHWVM